MMLKIINLTIKDIDVCRHSFNSSHISEELKEYLLSQCKATLPKDEIEINIYSKKLFTRDEKKELTDMIREHFGLEFRELNLIKEKNKLANLLCFLVGIIFLFIDILVNINPILSEIVLILGWVLIWESSYNVMFGEIKNRMKINRVGKLAKCKVKFFEEKNS